jgi:cytoskeletal protein CcmA (bactofilin family)
MSATAKSVRTAAESVAEDSESQKNLQHVVAGDSANVPLIPADGVFEGQVSVQGETRIDGEIRGTLRGTGRLELGPTSRIEGDIECEDVRSEGAIVGPVVAHRRAALGPGASLEGDIDAPVVEVDDGAVWNGTARVGSADRT